ncbi:hypothetical protein POM88_021794 [Heracleum sosnowskyi]|uniref:Uncharacterized protein n=1 Tax=Heracleum sosnowskyi TaxID=360622 RepID=A0AAD8IFJ2_9APIA|nr:hypothetical protein POM88_021794 [Heracleum sosnowskyi]
MVLDRSENSINDQGSSTMNSNLHNVPSFTTSIVRKRVGTVRSGDVLDNLDVRMERQICKQVQNSDSSDADDDFFTHGEIFENMGGSRQSGHNVRESKMKLSMKMVRTSMNREGTGRYESKARKMMREDEATEEKCPSMTKGRGLFSSAKQLCTAKQKVKCYAHNLGYNVVESFDAKTCSVKIKAGVIKIDDTTVHNVMGLPIGNEVIKCNEKNSGYVVWAEQFPGCASSQITPLMVRNKLLGNRRADTNFKWNFLIMVYNFFIESNQNRYLMRDILRFSGNIEKCSNYNWCQLLIDKLKTTHGYWATDRKRNFVGPFPFLIYLYVCKVRNKNTTRVPRAYPVYRAWSDMLVHKRQKYDADKGCFGEGKLLKLLDRAPVGENDMSNEMEVLGICCS